MCYVNYTSVKRYMKILKENSKLSEAGQPSGHATSLLCDTEVASFSAVPASPSVKGETLLLASQEHWEEERMDGAG